MKPDQLLQELKDLAEKLGIIVLEQNFRSTGVRAKSGYCLVHDKPHYIMDKHKRIRTKIELLGEFLADQEALDTIFMVPAVREYLQKVKPHEKKKSSEKKEPGIAKERSLFKTERDGQGNPQP